MNAIQRETIVPLSKDKAFQLFVEGFSTWWPSDYTWSKESLVKVVMESKKEGEML